MLEDVLARLAIRDARQGEQELVHKEAAGKVVVDGRLSTQHKWQASVSGWGKSDDACGNE